MAHWKKYQDDEGFEFEKKEDGPPEEDEIQTDMPLPPSGSSEIIEEHIDEMHRDKSADELFRLGKGRNKEAQWAEPEAIGVDRPVTPGVGNIKNDEMMRAINQLIQINMEQTGYLETISSAMSEGVNIIL